MKHKGLIAVLQEIGIKLHKSRLEFLSMLIIGMIESRTVNLKTLVTSMQSQARNNSVYRRAQRFFSEVEIGQLLFTGIVLSLLKKERYILTIDRTNWKFGSLDINILMLAIADEGLAIPIAFRLLNKTGNSNSLERVQIIEHVLRFIPAEQIEVLLADREFIGRDWFGFLESRNIAFAIRMRENVLADEWFKLACFFNNLKSGQIKELKHVYKINGCRLSVIASRDKTNQLLIIVSNRNPGWALAMYKLRWQIESLFKALKTSGFNLEDTHLRHIGRLSTLIAVVSLAFVWALKTGHRLNGLKPIPRKSHGRRAVSVFRLGLDHLRHSIAMFSLDYKLLDKAFRFLSCT